MKKIDFRLIAFMNSHTDMKSGGDMVFIEIAKRLGDYKKVVVTSVLGKQLCQKKGLRAKYLVTTSETKFQNVIWTYIKRIIKAFFLDLKIGEKDILWGTSDFLPDVLPIFWLKMKNKKTKWVQHIFHLIPRSRKISFYSQRLSFLLIKQFADLIVIDNKILKIELIKLGFNPHKIFINYPGVEYLKLARAKTSRGYEGIFMGRLHPAKGIFELIKIWKLVCQENPKAKLGIIGKGSEEVVTKLKESIKNETLDKNIELLGYLPDEEAFSIIKASRIFVFPSFEEGFGIAPLEAQALGLPVVAWNLPVFEEIFQGGMIKIRTGDVKKFAREVIKLLEDKNFYQLLVKEAIDNANRFSWEETAKRELALIKRINQ